MQATGDDELQGANPVVALLRTLLPWVNPGGGGGAAAAAEPEIPAGLWSAALHTFPELAEYLSERGLHADAAGLSEDETRRIGRAIAAFLLSNR